jgi:hypothetical protein
MGGLNFALLHSTSRKLAGGGSPKSFVLSSFLRVSGCGIVAGVFAAVGPWWSMAVYIVALFVPFATHVIRVARES